MRLAALIALLATSALAGEYPEKIDRLGNGRDSLEIVSEASDRATVHYHNNIQQVSRSGIFTLQVGAIIVDVEIIIGGAEVASREIMIVRPRGDFIAIPDTIEAADGETVSVLVVLPMF